MNIDMTSP